MNNVKIIGTGSYAPDRIIKNIDLSKIVDTNDEWISTRTGIKERRITEGENTSFLSTKAALQAIKNADIDPLDIDLIVVGTASPDSFIPSTACLVQAEIGAENATCFDISAACTGFVYALNIGTQFIKTGQCKTALVIGAEVLSKIVDWSDRSTCVLFGDGAGAAILQKSEDNGILSIYTGSDGRNAAKLLGCSAVPVNNPFINTINEQNSLVTMSGKDIFRFGTKIVPKCIEEVLKNQDCKVQDIKYIVPHQANMRIIDSAAKRLDIDSNKFYINLDKYGNTSAASIPIALDEMNKDGLLKKGDKIILVGFGGGLTFGSALIEWMIN
ncbi:3-oxoacyl-[acyl-carrier-protein] synthase 3 [Clostridium pasteurianum DSM 525 = ATCC 6013]|uniref:Beta-ketoacyl-[acyl-carrier-protein] synthase III n=1 Tax=Clostridium pasteurianum DSM 525 = ATCC 6013 TaxID=1262449 RepID=A0A0H3J7W7_CLOPA|nr:beta-ketoacyl-ACP synthase III [Clostridium pasteurianum]AJA50001.1 3-oxoacyl-[acyl-carrier-protein] synthase 3 [Clostridium pasteurianum DSM 525 = ATCC 6013]AJA53989.1 3-oxoacyl-[acyl-carrier-protein] synthase [Clostridium pasteurianum DSM 525 = ATCC 6013]AOZ77132.1 3-oxoacyl-ACP synthase [Clostridium pasteurianum DSM 525 = ATCC 6013]AOZ80929.1 3-oxoacyl-ACP synthase [Clostridium pasteurianum]ELP59289.1 3-oxoacyl-(acyl carrier protein) synthase III [Clostridium pasteurianum DSM 525 = ATCC 